MCFTRSIQTSVVIIIIPETQISSLKSSSESHSKPNPTTSSAVPQTSPTQFTSPYKSAIQIIFNFSSHIISKLKNQVMPKPNTFILSSQNYHNNLSPKSFRYNFAYTNLRSRIISTVQPIRLLTKAYTRCLIYWYTRD